MIIVSVNGDQSVRTSAKTLVSKANVEFELNEEVGADAAQVLELTLLYGPPTIALLKSLVELINEFVKLKKNCRITIENKETDETT